MIQFTKRNLLLYFHNKASVFFSLLAVMITFLLYVFVFKNLYSVGLFGEESIQGITDLWAIGGILAAPTVTTPLGSLWVFVDDRNRKLYRDFYAAPVSRTKLTGGYLLSSFLIGIIMSTALLFAAQAYLLSTGAGWFSLQQYAMIFATLVLSTFSGAGFVLLLVSLFHSNDAFTSFSIIIGTLMGFLSGNYMPMGLMPEAAQNIIKLCPVAHTSALLRQILAKEPMHEILGGIPDIAESYFSQYMGIELTIGEQVIPVWGHIAYLAGTGIVFYSLAIFVLNKKRKK